MIYLESINDPLSEGPLKVVFHSVVIPECSKPFRVYSYKYRQEYCLKGIGGFERIDAFLRIFKDKTAIINILVITEDK